MHTDRRTPRTGPPGPRRLLTAALAVGLVAVGALAVLQLRPFDPMRPGTVRRVAVTMRGCTNPSSLTIDGRTWYSDELAPETWPNPWTTGSDPGASIPGVLEVTAPDVAVFTADRGGTLPFRRLREGAFLAGHCAVR